MATMISNIKATAGSGDGRTYGSTSGPRASRRGRGPRPACPEPEGLVEYEAVAWEPVVTRPDPMAEEGQQALLDAVTDQDSPWWLEEGDPDPDDDPPPGDCDLQEIAAQCRQISEDQARAAANAARLGATGALAAIAAARCGPGQPGSARRFPGEYPSRAPQFATGMLMDTMPGRPELAGFADEAAGPDDRFDGASDDEVLGVLCAWDRVEAHAAARKHAAVAELMDAAPPACRASPAGTFTAPGQNRPGGDSPGELRRHRDPRGGGSTAETMAITRSQLSRNAESRLVAPIAESARLAVVEHERGLEHRSPVLYGASDHAL